MPAKYGCRLQEHSHGAPRRRKASRESHRVSLPGPKARLPHDLPLGDDQLLAQKGVLRDELRARPEEICDKVASEPEEVEHGAPYTDRLRTAFVAITASSILDAR
jgi:hypothetical protein